MGLVIQLDLQVEDLEAERAEVKAGFTSVGRRKERGRGSAKTPLECGRGAGEGSLEERGHQGRQDAGRGGGQEASACANTCITTGLQIVQTSVWISSLQGAQGSGRLCHTESESAKPSYEKRSERATASCRQYSFTVCSRFAQDAET